MSNSNKRKETVPTLPFSLRSVAAGLHMRIKRTILAMGSFTTIEPQAISLQNSQTIMSMKPIFITMERNQSYSFDSELKHNQINYAPQLFFRILLDLNCHDMSTMKFTEEKCQHFCCACTLVFSASTCESIARHLLC